MLPQRNKQDVALSESERQSTRSADRPTLYVSRNGTILQKVSMEVPRLLIGRSEDSDITIPSCYVSRHHILLLRDGASTILIDLNSTNGTFVNSKRVSNRILANDDVITVDLHSMFVQYSIRFSDPGATSVGTSGEIESADAVVAKALAGVGDLIGTDDTDVLPALSENVPTKMGFIDDR